MTPQDIQQMIVTTINNMGNAQQYGVAKIPAHTHNGVDSPRISLPDNGNGNMNTNTYDPAGIAQQVVGTTAQQILTNKTLTNPTITEVSSTTGVSVEINSGFYSSLVTDLDGATITFDVSKSNMHTVTLGGNRTLAISNASIGQNFVIFLVQDGTGSRTVTWFSTIKWPSAVVPILTTTSGSADAFGFTCYSAGNYYGFPIGQDL